jgi:hypothetical protein
MKPRGGTSGVKPVDVDPERVKLHDIDSSKLSMSTTSVSMLPHLEATDAERVLNEEEKKKREARKLKREAREKKEQQRLDEKKARKEARRLKRKERRKRREARKKKEKEAKAFNTSSSELSSSSEDGDDDESYRVHSKKDKKGKGKKNDDNKYTTVSFNYSSMSMTSHDHKSFINVPAGKLPHFNGTNFAKWKHLIRDYLIGLHLGIWEVVCNGFEPPIGPQESNHGRNEDHPSQRSSH